MASGTNLDYRAMLEVLAEHDVEYVVIGNVAAALQGVGVMTLDLDIVHSRAPENLERLASALNELGAYYRGRGDQRLAPKANWLSSDGHHLLLTKWGPLDVLGMAGDQQTFDDLRPHTIEVQLNLTATARVIDLATLIALKEAVGREKDLAVLPLLRRQLEEHQRQNRPEPG